MTAKQTTPDSIIALASALELFSGRGGLHANTMSAEIIWKAADALKAYAALLRTPQEPTGIYDSAWVIEGMWSSTAYPEYWVGSSAWSSDPYKALRFASKQSAQQAADMMLVGINHRVACHEFAGNSHHE